MDQRIRKLIIITLSLLSLYLLYLLGPGIAEFFRFIFKVAFPFIFGFTIAFVLLPSVNFFVSHGIKRKWSVFIVSIVTLLGLIAFFSLIIPMLIKELTGMINNLPEYIDHLGSFLNRLAEKLSFLPDKFRPTPDKIESILADNLSKIVDNLIGIVQKSFSYILVLLITPILAIYFMLDFDKIVQWLKLKTSEDKHEKFRKLLIDIRNTMQAYFRGILLVTLILTVLSTIGFWLVGLDYAFVLGLIIGISDIIPYIGPYIGGAFVVLGASAISFDKALWALIVVLIAQFIEGNLLTPKIQSKQVKTHPILVILSLAFFGEIFGIFGMIIAVPLLAILQTIFKLYLESKKN